MATKKLDFYALAQAVDTTWGRTSTPRVPSYSVKLTFQGEDKLLVSYAAIVNFVTEKQMIEMKRAYATEADSIVSAAVKSLKSRYKDITGESLTVKPVKDSENDSIEIISMNIFNAKRTAYYRRKVTFEMS